MADLAHGPHEERQRLPFLRWPEGIIDHVDRFSASRLGRGVASFQERRADAEQRDAGLRLADLVAVL
jgi:hypothetical protein